MENKSKIINIDNVINNSKTYCNNSIIHSSRAFPFPDATVYQLMIINWQICQKNKKTTRVKKMYSEIDLNIINTLKEYFLEFDAKIDIHRTEYYCYPNNKFVISEKKPYVDTILLSFGDTKVFSFIDNDNKMTNPYLTLNHGDILIIDKELNKNFRYGITNIGKKSSFIVLCQVTFLKK